MNTYIYSLNGKEDNVLEYYVTQLTTTMLQLGSTAHYFC